MTGQQNRIRTSQIVVESALTRKMYAWILFLLGIRSWVFVLLAAVLVYVVWMSINSGNYSLLAIYASLLVVVYAGAILFSVLSRKTRSAYVGVKYTFSEYGVLKETAATSQTLKWNAFVRWRKIGAYYLIYMTKRSFFVIPKVKIPEGKNDTFENLLRRGIVKRQVRR
jgi:hypothetical protein